MITPEAFQIAKLAYFNLHLLRDMDQSGEPAVKNLIRNRCITDQVQGIGSILNQATLLQFVYFMLVWLWEQVKIHNGEDKLIEELGTNFDFIASCKIVGERKVVLPRDYLRIIRNSTSHASVACNKKTFVFSDFDKRKEKNPTTLEIEMKYLGRLCEQTLLALSRLVYPSPPPGWIFKLEEPSQE